MRRHTSTRPGWTRRPAAIVAALVLAGSCGNNGGSGRSTLADLAQGTWNCVWRATPAADLGGSNAGQDVKVTAKITPSTDFRGRFQLKLAGGTQEIALDGTWRLSGTDLTVDITHDSFAPDGSDNGGRLVYRGVTPDARTIEVLTDRPMPVDVSHRGGTYEFRWGDPADIQNQLTCHR